MSLIQQTTNDLARAIMEDERNKMNLILNRENVRDLAPEEKEAEYFPEIVDARNNLRKLIRFEFENGKIENMDEINNLNEFNENMLIAEMQEDKESFLKNIDKLKEES